MARFEETQDGKILTLCDPCCANCPEVTLNKQTGEFRLTDDYGGTVLLTQQQFQMLLENGKKLTD